MPSSHMYGGLGVEVIYPTPIMNTSQSSDQDWTNANLIRLDTYDFSGLKTSGSELSYPKEVHLNPTDFQPAYPLPQLAPPPIEISPIPNHVVTRPKSSPSTFGPNVEDIVFSENPFRIRQDDAYPQSSFSMSPIQITTKAVSPAFYGGDQLTPTSSISVGRPAPVPIAPDPAGLRQMNAMKRMREDEDHSDYSQRKRKRALSQSGPVELNDEEQLLLKLKEEENLPWKDIATRFQTDLGKSYQVPALQMRFKRLRERMRCWTETDVQALEQAFDYWEKFQFDIIAAKMLDFGASERWPAKYCARKWHEMHPSRAPIPAHHFLQDPWDADSFSPADTSTSPLEFHQSPGGLYHSPIGFHPSPRTIP